MRVYRGFLIGAMRAQLADHRAHARRCSPRAIFGCRFVPQQFFPASDRPELLVDLTLPQNASIFASERAVERLEAVLAEDPDVERWSTYVGRGAIRFYLPLDVQLANPFFAQVVVVAKDVEARERLQAQARDRCWPRSSPSVVGARLAARARAAGRLAGAVPRQRARHGRGARDRAATSPQVVAADPDTPRTSTSTGSSRRARCACASTRTRRACSA